MSDAIICERCGNTASTQNRYHRTNYTVKYKSIHKPRTFIGARNRKFDLCRNCRRELDEFLGLERGVSAKELEEPDTRQVPLDAHKKAVSNWRQWATLWFIMTLVFATAVAWPLL